MTTAMHELYRELEKLELITDKISISDVKRMIANYYILKEKEQVVNAVNSQKQTGWEEKGEDYYLTTFGRPN